MSSFPLLDTLVSHPDRIRWNSRYQRRSNESGLIPPADLLDLTASCISPPDPVLELAGGPSGTALALAEAGHRVTVTDISDTALDRLSVAAQARGIVDRLTLIHADLTVWSPPSSTSYALVLCRFYWDAAVFRRACDWTAPGGMLVWEAPALVAGRPVHGRAEWCLQPGEPASLLPDPFTVVSDEDLEHHGAVVRRLVAQRAADPAAPGSEDKP
ncbi:class I SAM-dependent methyltransferase [Streptomyces sp. NPDC005529]|uniref:class I SAM-dependent methyltransferase n=1 Tax=unclassified Streptomyces TaxID=2593676 RepID=UPI0033BED902